MTAFQYQMSNTPKIAIPRIAFVCLLALFCFGGCGGTVTDSPPITVADPQLNGLVTEDVQPAEESVETTEVATPAPVRALRLDNTEVDDAELERICREHPELVELTLGGTQITDAGLIHLLQLPRLRIIRLARTAVTDGGMNTLAKNEFLERVDLSSTQIGDFGLWELRALPRLRDLNLYRTPVTDQGLASFRRGDHRSAARIERLNIGRTAITDEGISKLASLTNLKWLFLAVTDITDAGLVELAKLAPLEEVNITRTETTLEGVERLRRERPDMNVRDNISEEITQEAIDEAVEFRRQR